MSLSRLTKKKEDGSSTFLMTPHAECCNHAECCKHVASSGALPGEEPPKLVFEARLFIQLSMANTSRH